MMTHLGIPSTIPELLIPPAPLFLLPNVLVIFNAHLAPAGLERPHFTIDLNPCALEMAQAPGYLVFRCSVHPRLIKVLA
jgi:hypothetical protein